ncbi:MAG: DUF1684 domain-containing protein [Crocinitomicaceae bacterium]
MKYVLIILSIILGFYATSQSFSSYNDSLLKERKLKEKELLDPSKGILQSEDLQHFESLHYFFIDSIYICKASFELNIGKKFNMPTSTERMPVYRRYGYLHFEIKGLKYQLTVYQNMELRKKKEFKNYFFVPFRDLTSGEMTYGGGRYLDLTILKNQTAVELDFNQAYNPYCAYSHRYSCPIPPEENTLKIAIYSGEKTPIYKD